MEQKRLRKYANLIANVGVHIRKGQEVIISAELDQPEFVKLLVEECYKAGAKKVIVDWTYSPLDKTHVRYRSEKTLCTLEEWELKRWEHQTEILPAKIYLVSDDPDGLRGIHQKKYAKMRVARSKAIKPYRDKMENKYEWCIAGVPGKAWAKKVFPGLRASAAVEKLWEAILETSRVFDDPVEEWNKHNRNLEDKCAKLNALGLCELRYSSENGTDLKVGLIPGASFLGGGETTLAGNFFNPNIPSEEVFTSPMAGKAEGIVYATMPLSHSGQLIDKFWVRFENGRAVDCGAETGEQVLRDIIAMDDGAAMLGECALVPFTSPIRNTGILFYNTLYDENAACHLALGRGFSSVLPDYENRSEEEAHKMGINDSITHVDFMIGDKTLNITGVTKDGKEVTIFKNGEWAL